jgi:hypothetical protein
VKLMPTIPHVSRWLVLPAWVVLLGAVAVAGAVAGAVWRDRVGAGAGR